MQILRITIRPRTLTMPNLWPMNTYNAKFQFHVDNAKSAVVIFDDYIVIYSIASNKL